MGGGGGREKGDHAFFRGNGWDQSSLAEYQGRVKNTDCQ